MDSKGGFATGAMLGLAVFYGLYMGRQKKQEPLLSRISLDATSELMDEFQAFSDLPEAERKATPQCKYGPAWRVLSKADCLEMLEQLKNPGKPDPRFGPN